MATTVTDPNLLLKLLLDEEWDTVSVTPVPDFSTGWLNRESSSPQVTCTGADESPVNGGQTGYSGIDPGGNGPTQTISGTVEVNCWADRDRVSGNPKDVVFDYSEEVKRIVQEWHDVATHPTITTGDYTYLAWHGRAAIPDPEAEPTMFRQRCIIGYGYENRP